MNKKWRNIIIVSMIILLIEVGGSLFFLFPYYRMQRVFNSIDDGQWEKAQNYYNELSSEQQQKVDSYMRGYAAYLTKLYIDGKRDYIHTAASFDAINSIQNDASIFAEYTPLIDRNEYVKLVNQLYKANVEKNTDDKYAAIAKLTDIQKRISNDTREGILIEMLNQKLDMYVDGQISYENMSTFAYMVSTMSINQAYNYSLTVEGYAQNIKSYREEYKKIADMTGRQEYLEVIDLINEQHIYDFDVEYTNDYAEAYKNAYDTGKEYYTELLRSYINSNDSDSAVKLMARLEEVYGDEIDLTFAKDAMMTDWQKACVARVEDWEEYLEDSLNKTSEGRKILANEYDKLKPDSITLFDIDEDGTPELCMFNSNQVDNDYVGTFVFGYDGKEYTYAGYVNIISFGIKSNIVAFPTCFDRTPGEEEVCLYNYDGSTLTQGSCTQKMGGKYYVDGAEASDIDYLSSQTAIMLNQSTVRIQNSGYVPMDQYKEYIIAYEGE